MKLTTENLSKNGKKSQVRQGSKRRSVLTDIKKRIYLKEDVYQELHGLIRHYENELRGLESRTGGNYEHVYRHQKLKNCLNMARALEPIARENKNRVNTSAK